MRVLGAAFKSPLYKNARLDNTKKVVKHVASRRTPASVCRTPKRHSLQMPKSVREFLTASQRHCGTHSTECTEYLHALVKNIMHYSMSELVRIACGIYIPLFCKRLLPVHDHFIIQPQQKFMQQFPLGIPVLFCNLIPVRLCLGHIHHSI